LNKKEAAVRGHWTGSLRGGNEAFDNILIP